MAKRVMCVETQEVFESVTKAGEWCDAPTTNISAVCKGKRRTAKGYHWEYVEDVPVIEPVEQHTDDLAIDELAIATLLENENTDIENAIDDLDDEIAIAQGRMANALEAHNWHMVQVYQREINKLFKERNELLLEWNENKKLIKEIKQIFE